MPGAETPTKISAPFKASARLPVRFPRLVTLAIFSCIQLRPSMPSQIMPALSQRVMFWKPYVRSSFVMAIPALPAPFTTTWAVSLFFPVTFKALIMPASTTMAVPC